jgi:hypothetical protein
MDIQQKVEALPLDIKETQPLLDVLPSKKEKDDE